MEEKQKNHNYSTVAIEAETLLDVIFAIILRDHS